MTLWQGQKYRFRVFVVDRPTDTLLGRGAATQMGLVKRIDEVNKRLAELPKMLTELEEDADPYAVHTPVVLLYLYFRLMNLGVIEEVTEPTPWCAPVVPVLKRNGSVRLCVDLKKLNRAVKRERYVMPTLQDVTSRLSGKKWFSSLDATCGFYQIPLDAESKKLTTFITPMGCFCFTRVPFGLNSAPEIFTRKMHKLFEGEENVIVWMDEVLVAADTAEEHDKLLEKVLGVLEKNRVTVNWKKSLIRKNNIPFLGQEFGPDGVRPDDDKVAAIVDMGPPTSVSQLRQFLGMVNYLGVYLPNLHKVLKPLNDLLRSDVTFQWGPAQNDSFNQVKGLLMSEPVLAYCDMNKPMLISADASSYGVGGVLMQQHDNVWKPIAYCLRTLTSAEQRYAQIEKECLAGVWACEKFDWYILGLDKVKLITDHKPLIPLINSKDLGQVPLRCQRLLMRLMRYNVHAEYAPGKTLVVADTLSRCPRQCDEEPSTVDEVELYVDSITANRPASPERMQELKDSTRADVVLRTPISYTTSGWPKYQRDVHQSLFDLFAIRGQLSVCDNLLTYGDRIVIPVSLRADMLERIHEGHFGINKCLERARHTVWWPGITSDIKRIVSNCESCQVKLQFQYQGTTVHNTITRRSLDAHWCRFIRVREPRLHCSYGLLLSMAWNFTPSQICW